MGWLSELGLCHIICVLHSCRRSLFRFVQHLNSPMRGQFASVGQGMVTS